MGLLAARIAGVACCVALGYASLPPKGTIDEADARARFAFQPTALLASSQTTVLRRVHPALRHIGTWVSGFGAGVALGDIDGDGRFDDACVVDPRSDEVWVLRNVASASLQRTKLEIPTGKFPAASVAPMGCLIAELNGDGRPDLLVYFWGRSPVAFIAGQDGRYLAREILKTPEVWYSNAAMFADVDGDGHLDLLVGNYFCDNGHILGASGADPVCPAGRPMQESWSRSANGGGLRLLRRIAPAGADDLRFDDVSGAVPEAARGGWTLAIATADINGDQLPEIYLANDFGSDRLLVNCSDSVKSFGSSREALHCTTSRKEMSFRLVEGRRTADVPRSKTLGRDSFKGMGAEFADVDARGVQGLLVSNITAAGGLQESQLAFERPGVVLDAKEVEAGRAPFQDASRRLNFVRSGWAWDVKAADFDNDGRLEIVQSLGYVQGTSPSLIGRGSNCWPQLQELATANDYLVPDQGAWFTMISSGGLQCDLSGQGAKLAFFAKGDDGRYQDVLKHLSPNIDVAGVSRGIAIGDVNGDGAVDFINATQDGVVLLLNAHPNGHFVALDVRVPVVWPASDAQGSSQTTPAIGAQVLLLADGVPFLHTQVDGGSGHSGKRSPLIHAGIAPAHRHAKLSARIWWRQPGTGEPSCRVMPDLPQGKRQTVILDGKAEGGVAC